MLHKNKTTTNSKEQKTVICAAYKRMKDVATTCILRAVNASEYVCGQSSAPDAAEKLTARGVNFRPDLGSGFDHF